MAADTNKPKGNIHAKVLERRLWHTFVCFTNKCMLELDEKPRDQHWHHGRLFFLNILVFFIRKNLQLFLHLEHEDGHNSNIKIFQELLALAVPP